MSLTFWSIENVVNLFKFVYSFWKSKIIILKNNKSPLFVINFLPLKMFPQKQLSEDTKECHTDCLVWYSSDSEDDFVPEKRRKTGSCINYLSFALYKNYLSQLTLTLTTTPSVNQEPQPSTVASKDSPSLCLADQDPSTSPSVSPQGVVKWKDLDQEVKDIWGRACAGVNLSFHLPLSI